MMVRIIIVLAVLVLLVVAALVVLWQKLASLRESLRTTRVQLRSFNENYFSGAGKGMDRKEIEKLIANSNALAELSQAVSRLQYQVGQLEGRSAGRPADGGKGNAGKGLVPVRQAADGKAPAAVKLEGVGEADVFYMAGPVNNYFPNNAKSLTKENTVYRFKLNANKQEAEFELHTSGAPIMEIVQLAESYIKTACDEENLPPYTVKNIVTKRAGKAILEGDKWVIKSKALIRYE